MSTPPPAPPRKRHGCFFYGCLTSIFLCLIAAVVAVVLVLNAPKILNRIAHGYTDATPTQLERVDVTPAELKEIEQRVAKFQQALRDGSSSQELVLTAHDINALIAGDPAFKDLRDKLFVTIEGDTIKGQISLPMDSLGPIRLPGRYLNAEVAFRISLENGQLGVYLSDIRVKGQPLPGLMVSKFKDQNLAQDYQKDPQTAAQIRQFDSIKVEDGKVILRNKAKAQP